MTETKMPATEANEERNSYEFAFHVLPTVAEGEVAGVFDTIKAHITKVGEIFDEEAPERLDLEYPIVKQFDGKNRKFTSAYFGWVRFRLNASEVDALVEELSVVPNLLRHLLIKLTALEESKPFRIHEYRKSVKMVATVYEDATLSEAPTEVEESVEVSKDALDESLEKITTGEEEVK